MKPLDRVLLLATGLLAAYQIVVGVKGADAFQFLESQQTDPIGKNDSHRVARLAVVDDGGFCGRAGDLGVLH